MQEAIFQENSDSRPLWPLPGQPDGILARKPAASAIAIGIAFGVLCATGRLLAPGPGGVATFWVANGVLTAIVLCLPKNRWWAVLSLAWLGNAVSLSLLGSSLWMSGSLAFCNTIEVLIAAWLLRRAVERNPDLASASIMIQFLLFAVVLAPAASSLLRAADDALMSGERFWQVFGLEFPSYALGMAAMAPLTLAAGDRNLRKIFDRGRRLRSVSVLLLILLVSFVVFQVTHYSLRALCLPLLMLAIFEVGILGAALAIFEILVVGSLYTLHGHGPLWMEKGATLQGSILILQFASLVLLVSVIPYAAILERQHQLRKHLRHGMQRYRLLADNSRDIVVLSSLEGRRLYVSPAVQDVLGWTQDEWTDRDCADLMHPNDVAAFQRMLQEIMHGEDRRTFRYRTQHKNGQYLWMEASIRTLPDAATGKPDAFVANLRDISLRVDAESKLAEAHRQVRQQAQRDSLTELANRRRFDEGLEKEWRRGRRTGSSLALLMVDIDHFKCINDAYGHRAGDHCLQAVAAELRRISRRPGDIAARYGGDEFAVLLPDVDLATALVLADRLWITVREQLFDAGIGHSVRLSVSIGVAALVPDMNARADLLVEAADKALYAAKQRGRDQVVAEQDREMAAIRLHPVL